VSGRTRLLALVGLAGALVLAAAAIAATGSLTFRGCVANAAADGCEAPKRDSFGNNVALAVSPDGGSIYVVSVNGTLTRLTRDGSTGDLSFADCFADGGRHRCRDVPHDSLDGGSGVAISPDGASVYMTTEEPTSAINRFKITQTGRFGYRSCLANGGGHSGTRSCDKPPRNSLHSNEAIAISPDGRSAYVVSSGSDSITWLARGSNGKLRYRGCVADGGKHGCHNPKHDSLAGAFDVAMSPDGESVYVASLAGDAVTWFDRQPTGALVYKGCIANDGKHGCRAPKRDALGGADALAVSPDGRSVYVAAIRANAIVNLSRSPSGRLEPGGCFASFGAHECRRPLQNSLHAADAVTVSPDGASVYVSAMSGPTVNGGAGAISMFSRGADGSLTSRGCFADGGRHECEPPPLDSLDSPESIAVSPDGRSVYVGSFGRAVTIFDREQALP
jgi:DNA-binding beta-propeller fold protein YncE